MTTNENEIATIRAENARLREQLSESHCAARVTEMQKRCSRAEAAERFAEAFCGNHSAESMTACAVIVEQDSRTDAHVGAGVIRLAAEYIRARDAAGGT